LVELHDVIARRCIGKELVPFWLVKADVFIPRVGMPTTGHGRSCLSRFTLTFHCHHSEIEVNVLRRYGQPREWRLVRPGATLSLLMNDLRGEVRGLQPCHVRISHYFPLSLEYAFPAAAALVILRINQ
jgi:hypothetical protein